MTCTNQIKQITLACQNYHDIHQSLPMCLHYLTTGSSQTNRWAGSIQVGLLPYSEQSALYEATQTTNVKSDNSSNGTAPWAVRLPYIMCPSDSGRSLDPKTDCGPTNYFASNGDWPERMFFDGSAKYTTGDRLDVWTPTTNTTYPDRENKRGAFNYHPLATRRFADITDGTSNTIAFSEHLIGKAGDKTLVTRGILQGSDALSTNTTGNLSPGNLFTNVRDLNDRSRFYPTIPSAHLLSDFMGQSWGHGSSRTCGFQTIFPPNSPSGSGNGTHNSQTHIMSASSLHAGGVIASRIDGSVFFVSETINCGDLTKKPKDAIGGISPYGVWGAMGSIAGGESVGL